MQPFRGDTPTDEWVISRKTSHIWNPIARATYVPSAISKRIIDIIWLWVRIDTSTSALWSRWPARSYQSNNINREWYNVIVVRHFHVDKSRKSCSLNRLLTPLSVDRVWQTGRRGRPVKCHLCEFHLFILFKWTRKNFEIIRFFRRYYMVGTGAVYVNTYVFPRGKNSFISKHCQGRTFRATFISITCDKRGFA